MQNYGVRFAHLLKSFPKEIPQLCIMHYELCIRGAIIDRPFFPWKNPKRQETPYFSTADIRPRRLRVRLQTSTIPLYHFLREKQPTNPSLSRYLKSPPRLEGGAPKGRGDIKNTSIPQSNCLISAICQPPLGKGALDCASIQLLDKFGFVPLRLSFRATAGSREIRNTH